MAYLGTWARVGMRGGMVSRILGVPASPKGPRPMANGLSALEDRALPVIRYNRTQERAPLISTEGHFHPYC